MSPALTLREKFIEKITFERFQVLESVATAPPKTMDELHRRLGMIEGYQSASNILENIWDDLSKPEGVKSASANR